MYVQDRQWSCHIISVALNIWWPKNSILPIAYPLMFSYRFTYLFIQNNSKNWRNEVFLYCSLSLDLSKHKTQCSTLWWVKRKFLRPKQLKNNLNKFTSMWWICKVTQCEVTSLYRQFKQIEISIFVYVKRPPPLPDSYLNKAWTTRVIWMGKSAITTTITLTRIWIQATTWSNDKTCYSYARLIHCNVIE